MEKLTKEIQNYTVYTKHIAHSASRFIGGWTAVSIPLPKMIRGISTAYTEDVLYEEHYYLRPSDRPILSQLEESLCQNVCSRHDNNVFAAMERAYVKVQISDHICT